MRTMGYHPCLADRDLWYKSIVRPDDGYKCYACMLLYVDDCLSIHYDATSALDELDWYFQMKPGSIGDPQYYLGAKLRQCTLPNGVMAWGMSFSKYVQEAVRNVEDYLRRNQQPGLSKRATAPFPSGYAAELDDTRQLTPSEANYYQSQVGILRWIVELGRVDIITEVSVLASYLAVPRRGHMDAVYHVYAYLRRKHNARLVLDPTYPTEDPLVHKSQDWLKFYGEVREAIPPNMPEPRGKEVDIRLFVDSSHADDKLHRRSRTGYLIYLNMSLVAWLSKKQATIETSVFGAEFVAMKIGIEALRGMRYKLRMMGAPISGPSLVCGDNMPVIHNTQRPESTLKKKSI